MKRVSDDDDDDEFESEFDFLRNKTCLIMIKVKNIRISQYHVCKYDEQHWIGFVPEVDQEVNDVMIQFMNPHYPSNSLSCPPCDDVCWMAQTQLIAGIESPILSSFSARQYHLSKKDISAIANLIQ